MNKLIMVGSSCLSLVMLAATAFADGQFTGEDKAFMADAQEAASPKAQEPSSPAPSTESKETSSPREVSSVGQAHGETLATAVAHYARARSLLIAAVRAFDEGYKTAKPDTLLDSKEWRDTLISRAEELEKVLAPQPKASKSGIQFGADHRLLNTEAKSRSMRTLSLNRNFRR